MPSRPPPADVGTSSVTVLPAKFAGLEAEPPPPAALEVVQAAASDSGSNVATTASRRRGDRAGPEGLLTDPINACAPVTMPPKGLIWGRSRLAQEPQTFVVDYRQCPGRPGDSERPMRRKPDVDFASYGLSHIGYVWVDRRTPPPHRQECSGLSVRKFRCLSRREGAPRPRRTARSSPISGSHRALEQAVGYKLVSASSDARAIVCRRVR